jgi:hypothetical protein
MLAKMASTPAIVAFDPQKDHVFKDITLATFAKLRVSLFSVTVHHSSCFKVPFQLERLPISR